MLRCPSCKKRISARNIARKVEGTEQLRWFQFYYNKRESSYCKHCGAKLIIRNQGLLLILLAMMLAIAVLVNIFTSIPRIVIFLVLFALIIGLSKKIVIVERIDSNK